MAGTAVLRMVVSSDSMNRATATSQGNRLLLAAERAGGFSASIGGWGGNFAGRRTCCHAGPLLTLMSPERGGAV